MTGEGEHKHEHECELRAVWTGAGQVEVRQVHGRELLQQRVPDRALDGAQGRVQAEDSGSKGEHQEGEYDTV